MKRIRNPSGPPRFYDIGQEPEVIDPASPLTKLAAFGPEILEKVKAVQPGDRVDASWAPIVKIFGRTFYLAPVMWLRFQGPDDLQWDYVDFSEDTLQMVPSKSHGVYGIQVLPPMNIPPGPSYLIYIGETHDQSLQQRYEQHLKKLTRRDNKQPKLSDAVKLWNGYLRFYFAPVEDRSKIKSIEAELIGSHLPPCNQKFPAGVQSMIDALRE